MESDSNDPVPVLFELIMTYLCSLISCSLVCFNKRVLIESFIFQEAYFQVKRN